VDEEAPNLYDDISPTAQADGKQEQGKREQKAVSTDESDAEDEDPASLFGGAGPIATRIFHPTTTTQRPMQVSPQRLAERLTAMAQDV